MKLERTHGRATALTPPDGVNGGRGSAGRSSSDTDIGSQRGDLMHEVLERRFAAMGARLWCCGARRHSGIV
jgi:hypothetical protein